MTASDHDVDDDPDAAQGKIVSHNFGRKAGLLSTPLRAVIDSLPGLPHQKSSGFAGAADFGKRGNVIDSRVLEELTFYVSS